MSAAPRVAFHLEGRRALVTGAVSGIGLATATQLARTGARVALNDLPGAALDAAVATLRQAGHDVLAAGGDLGAMLLAERILKSGLVKLLLGTLGAVLGVLQIALGVQAILVGLHVLGVLGPAVLGH